MNDSGAKMGIDHARLDPFRRRQSPLQEHVIDQFVSGSISRRSFVRTGSMLGIGLTSMSAILSACGETSNNSNGGGGGGKSGATIRVGQQVPDEKLTPLDTGAEGSIATFGLCGEWLTLVDTDLNVRPWLAESWKPNADGTAWDFKIRQGTSGSSTSRGSHPCPCPCIKAMPACLSGCSSWGDSAMRRLWSGSAETCRMRCLGARGGQLCSPERQTTSMRHRTDAGRHRSLNWPGAT